MTGQGSSFQLAQPLCWSMTAWTSPNPTLKELNHVVALDNRSFGSSELIYSAALCARCRLGFRGDRNRPLISEVHSCSVGGTAIKVKRDDAFGCWPRRQSLYTTSCKHTLINAF